MDLGLWDLATPGWFELQYPGQETNSIRVLVKAAERDGRIVITRMVILGDLLDSADLRAIPIGRAESFLNGVVPTTPEGRSQDFLEEITREKRVSAEMSPATQRPVEFDALDSTLNAFQATRPPARAPARKSAHEPLMRPDGSDPEAFSRRVARAYSEAVATTAHPAKVLAEEAAVPVTTVHRWIREARQRGFLPPARRGRAG